MRQPYGYKYNMNYWDKLSCELQELVLGFLATTIQKTLRRKIATAKQSLQFVNELLIECDSSTESVKQFEDIDTMSPRTSSIVKYCSKHADYTIGESTWSNFIIRLEADLWDNEYYGGPGAIYHVKIQKDLQFLKQRLIC